MLRITLQDELQQPTIKLEGKIVGPWVEELRRIWQSFLPSMGARGLRLDLRAVTFADAEGQRLLGEIYEESRAEFLTDSPLTAYFADVASQRISVSRNQGAHR
jgi:hypothetical protein